MSRLHVDRPCRVRRAGTGWEWTCWLCPLPHSLTAHEAGDYLAGSWAAHSHIQTEHATTAGRRAAA